MAAISIVRPSSFQGVGIIEKRSPSRFQGTGIIDAAYPSRFQGSNRIERVSRFQEVVPIPTAKRPSSYFGAGAINLDLPSRFFSSGSIQAKLPSRYNTSANVTVKFPSSFQSISQFKGTAFPSTFCSSSLAPEIGVDPIGNLQFTITPENPAAVQSP